MADGAVYSRSVAKGLRLERPVKERRLVRVVNVTAADLPAEYRAIADRDGLDVEGRTQLAFYALQRERARGRNAGESEAAYDLHERRRSALAIARQLVLTLDPSSGLGDREVIGTIAAIEAGVARLRGLTAPKAERLEAVIHALDHASGLMWPDPETGKRTHDPGMHSRVQSARTVATRKLPELGVITEAQWQRAIERWQGYRVPKVGGSRRAHREAYDAREVLFELLKPHGLTDASSAVNLGKTLRSKAKPV